MDRDLMINNTQDTDCYQYLYSSKLNLSGLFHVHMMSGWWGKSHRHLSKLMMGGGERVTVSSFQTVIPVHRTTGSHRLKTCVYTRTRHIKTEENILAKWLELFNLNISLLSLVQALSVNYLFFHLRIFYIL